MFTMPRLPLLGVILLLLAATVQAAPKRVSPRPPLAVDRFTFIAYGDTRSNPLVHASIIKEIVGLHPEFVLQSGDLVSDGGNARQWTQFDQITQPLRAARIAYYPARGNHDLGTFYPHYVPNTFDSGDKVNRLYYAFTRHHNRFIIVDSMEPYDPGSAQYVWLERELAHSKAAVNTFVMFHEAPFSVGPHGPTLEAQKYLHPLFVKYRPRAVFCGHDHLYYRTRRDGVTYIVTGGGGAPLYDPDNRDLAIPGDVIDKDYHTIRCVVDGPRVTGTVKTPDGRVIDRFTLGPK